jgi:hypothetical protein
MKNYKFAITFILGLLVPLIFNSQAISGNVIFDRTFSIYPDSRSENIEYKDLFRLRIEKGFSTDDLFTGPKVKFNNKRINLTYKKLQKRREFTEQDGNLICTVIVRDYKIYQSSTQKIFDTGSRSFRKMTINVKVEKTY